MKLLVKIIIIMKKIFLNTNPNYKKIVNVINALEMWKQMKENQKN